MADSEIVNRYERAVRAALEGLCREYTGRDTGWFVKTWLHPIGRSVDSVAVAPEFGGLSITARANLVLDYLDSHLSREESGHVGRCAAVTPEEYERGDWQPPEAQLVLAER